MLVKNWLTILIAGFLAVIYFYLLAVPINLATADLGRHIRNGEQLVNGNFEVLYTNYYSYTNPEFPFVNHHWLGGAIFYLTALIGGLVAVQILFIGVSLGAFGVFFYVAKKYSNIEVSSIVALLILPLLGYRYEVRPEVFSYLFAGIYYLVCRGFFQGNVGKKWLFGLPLLQLIWVNTHIYFFVGFLILGLFWVEGLVKWARSKNKGELKKFVDLSVIGAMSGVVSLLNPHFLNGLIYPFKILGNYGYRVLENQSVFFLEGVISVPAILYLKMALGVLIISWIYKFYRVFRFKEDFSFVDFILSITLAYLALTQIRNMALFGFFSLVIISVNLKSLKMEMNNYLVLPALGVIFILMLMINPGYWEGRGFGLGLVTGIDQGAEFFVKENVKGPIFNNYDVGGYLIYYLFPKEKVFVDNRPEGYPVEFFEKTYVPMQEKDEIWKEKLAEYNFNSIFFYRNDLTPWAQAFLISRIKDPEWAAVFVDNYNIIFVRRNEQNLELIKKYELPKSLFGISGSNKDT